MKNYIPHINRRKLLIILAIFITITTLLVITYSAYHYINRSNSVARVDGVYVTESAYRERSEVRSTILGSTAQQELTEQAVARDITELLIDNALIASYAQENGIEVDEREIDERYEYMVGIIGESTLEDKLEDIYGDDVGAYRDVLAEDILREKVQDGLDEPLVEWLESRRQQVNIDIYN